MANDGKYLNLSGGSYTLENAINASAGVADAGKIFKLDATGRVDPSAMPVGVGSETLVRIGSEALAAGNLINFHNNAGTINVRKADATATGKPANGFVLAATGAAANAVVYPEEAVITGLAGLTIGAIYFLATVAGGLTTVAPSASGNVVQEVGIALSVTELLFRPRQPVLLA